MPADFAYSRRVRFLIRRAIVCVARRKRHADPSHFGPCSPRSRSELKSLCARPKPQRAFESHTQKSERRAWSCVHIARCNICFHSFPFVSIRILNSRVLEPLVLSKKDKCARFRFLSLLRCVSRSTLRRLSFLLSLSAFAPTTIAP